MVVAVCALVFAMAGSAIAGTDGLSSKITKAKVKAIAKKQANKRLKANVDGSHVNLADRATNADNATNATNAENAVNATTATTAGNGYEAIAYVDAGGALVPDRSVGMGGTTIQSLGAGGGYCFGNMPFVPHAAVANLRTFSSGGEIDSGVPPDTTGACAADHSQYRVQTYNSGGTGTNRAFVVVFFTTG